MVIIADHPKVRANHICPRCSGVKSADLLLCWPCHQTETISYGGRYSEPTEDLLDRLEAAIREEMEHE